MQGYSVLPATSICFPPKPSVLKAAESLPPLSKHSSYCVLMSHTFCLVLVTKPHTSSQDVTAEALSDPQPPPNFLDSERQLETGLSIPLKKHGHPFVVQKPWPNTGPV
jgi:hypothetical protein